MEDEGNLELADQQQAHESEHHGVTLTSPTIRRSCALNFSVKKVSRGLSPLVTAIASFFFDYYSLSLKSQSSLAIHKSLSPDFHFRVQICVLFEILYNHEEGSELF
ncbi:hypothetical protein Pfo_007137 [Paulownia fortunei]|nr:hypothetical protein Pfo_007137 [Paulownia fortunei]